MTYHHRMFSSPGARRDACPAGMQETLPGYDPDHSAKTIHLFDEGSGETGFIAAALRKAGFCVEVRKTAATLGMAINDRNTAAVLIEAQLLSESMVRALSRTHARHAVAPIFVTSGDQAVLDRIGRLATKTGFDSLETIRSPFSARYITQRIAAKLGDPSSMLQQLDVLSAALRGWIEPVLLPRHDLATGQIVSAEFSTRMIHPEFGMLDDATIMRHLDREATRTLFLHNLAFVQQHFILGACKKKCPVAIRIDAAGLAALAGELRLVCEQTPGLRDGLRLKIAEADLAGLSGDQMRAACRVAAHISLDSFTADRSVVPDSRLSIREVTIDKAIIRGVAESDQQQRALVAALDRALALGARTVADGVESPEDLEFLKKTRCNDAQGALIGELVTLNDFGVDAP